MARHPTYHTTGQPYEALRAGPYWFLPWADPVFGPDGIPKGWKHDPDTWRTPAGKRRTTEQIQDWAAKHGYELRRYYTIPKLIDSDELEREERILYG